MKRIFIVALLLSLFSLELGCTNPFRREGPVPSVFTTPTTPCAGYPGGVVPTTSYTASLANATFIGGNGPDEMQNAPHRRAGSLSSDEQNNGQFNSPTYQTGQKAAPRVGM